MYKQLFQKSNRQQISRKVQQKVCPQHTNTTFLSTDFPLKFRSQINPKIDHKSTKNWLGIDQKARKVVQKRRAKSTRKKDADFSELLSILAPTWLHSESYSGPNCTLLYHWLYVLAKCSVIYAALTSPSTVVEPVFTTPLWRFTSSKILTPPSLTASIN